MQKIWVPQAVACGMLLLALDPNNSYSYYVLLRWVCCAVFVYLATRAHAIKKLDWVWILGVAAAIYNPIIPLHLTRDIWFVVNVVTIGIAAASIIALTPKDAGTSFTSANCSTSNPQTNPTE